ncbi:unnamed protein product [Pleuronectes platessa]|uniref:Ig-like domain-containing protein n=1 Tax=Pleuronectes platessa TaxID=8262 RepID=A0A9N7YB06_PLEPL|nr:unnamed protein product [Pleuronectes platessa]
MPTRQSEGKEAGDNRIRPGGKRVKSRPTKVKDGGTKGQSLLTQVLDKGLFLRLGPTATLTPGRNMELRCKGSNIGWSYPAYLDTFNDSRLSIKQSDKYSQLILTSPSAADTGAYSCWVIMCDGTECEKDHDRSHVSCIYFTGFLIYFGYGMWHSVERQRLLQLSLSSANTTQEQSKSSREKQDGVGAAGKEQERFLSPEKTSQC